MPGSRRKLHDVARGVASSFCSRNNDYERAWLPGVLRRRTLGHRDDVLVDLLGARDDDDLLDTIRVEYSSLLRSIAERVGLTGDVVRAAHLSVEYRPREPNWSSERHGRPRGLLDRPTWWFVATVSIEDDRGRTWSATDASWCWPETRALPAGRAVYDADGNLCGDPITLLIEKVRSWTAARTSPDSRPQGARSAGRRR